MTWTARGQLHDGRRYTVTWPGELPAELAELVLEAAGEAFLATVTGPTLRMLEGGAWLLALLRERTELEQVTGRPPSWPLPPGAVG